MGLGEANALPWNAAVPPRHPLGKPPGCPAEGDIPVARPDRASLRDRFAAGA